MNRKMVPFASYPNEMEASLVVQRLEAEGIPAFVKPLGGGYGILGVNQFIPHRVHVPIEMLEQARRLASDEPPVHRREYSEDS